MSAPTSNTAPATGTSIIDQTKNLVAQTVEQVTNLANQAANSQAAATVTEQAKVLGSQAAAVASSAATTAAATASSLAGQAHVQAHAAAPSIIPAPAGVDKSHDLTPHSTADQAKLEKLFKDRPDAKELQEHGILHGAPNDALAGKKAELERSMKENKLEKELAQRPSPEELVNKGILSPDEAPPSK